MLGGLEAQNRRNPSGTSGYLTRSRPIGGPNWRGLTRTRLGLSAKRQDLSRNEEVTQSLSRRVEKSKRKEEADPEEGVG